MKWIGIDISHKAYELVKKRLSDEVPEDLFRGEPNYETEPPKRDEDESDGGNKKYVYIIVHPKYPSEYKVGVAKDVISRLGSYQTGDPDRAYEIEHKKLTSHYNEIEKHVHEVFDNKGEWVCGNLDEIKKEIETWRPNK